MHRPHRTNHRLLNRLCSPKAAAREEKCQCTESLVAWGREGRTADWHKAEADLVLGSLPIYLTELWDASSPGFKAGISLPISPHQSQRIWKPSRFCSRRKWMVLPENNHLCCECNFKAILRKPLPTSAYSKVPLGDDKGTCTNLAFSHPSNCPSHGAECHETPCPSPAELAVAPTRHGQTPGATADAAGTSAAVRGSQSWLPGKERRLMLRGLLALLIHALEGGPGLGPKYPVKYLQAWKA